MIPKKLNILSDAYRIVIEPDYFTNENDPNKLLCGDCDLNDKIIRLRRTENNAMLKVFLHEVIHAICHELNLYDSTHDENFIDRLSVGLVDTLLRNKLLKGA
jgi:hypothetical protein